MSVRGFWAAQGLSARIINALAQDNIGSLEQLRGLTKRDFLHIPNVGLKCAREIEEKFGADIWDSAPEPPPPDKFDRVIDLLEKLINTIEKLRRDIEIGLRI